MRLGLIGKGGSGKTTLSAALALQAATHSPVQAPVLAIDADINQTLGPLLGFSPQALAALPPLGTEKDVLRAHIRGSSQRIRALTHIVKTTLPTPGGNLLQLAPDDPVLSRHGLWHGRLCLLPLGGFTESDIGVACYHSKTGAVELLLNHLPDSRSDVVLTDFSAGADLFASGLFTRYDLLLLVVEPTAQSVQVAKQILAYSAPYDVSIRIAAHKIEQPDDLHYLHEALGTRPDYALPYEPGMRQLARRGVLELAALSTPYKKAVSQILADLHAAPRDRHAYWDAAVDWHKRNASAWANATTGTQLEDQIDEEYLASLAFPT